MKLYPAFQDYFRKAKPPLLAIWGKNDPFFVPAGAEAFRKDIPNARVEFLDTGHFATGDARCRNCRCDERVPGSERRIAPDKQRGLTMSSFAQNATIVLVHGAWADGSCWHNIILPLRQEGLKVTCAPIPLTSLTEDIAALQRVIARIRGPVLLVGHAYAGAVIAGREG